MDQKTINHLYVALQKTAEALSDDLRKLATKRELNRVGSHDETQDLKICANELEYMALNMKKKHTHLFNRQE